MLSFAIDLPISNAKELGSIRVRKQNRDAAVSRYRRKVVAIDTEAHDGDIFLIADSNGCKLEYPDITFEKVAQFLLRYDEGHWIFFWNLAYDAECILKLLPEQVLKSQYISRGELRFEYNGYVIHYIEKKQLSIRKGRHTATCHDIQQFYEEKKLEQAYLKNIGEALDDHYLAIKNERGHFTLAYFMHNKKRIRDYCFQDCRLTKELAEHWLEIFYRQFGFYPLRWVSSGYLAEKVLIQEGIHLPYFNDFPYDLQEMAWQSFYGGRFELIKRGNIGKCYLYDINSAYPYSLTKLPDITDGHWIAGKRIHPQAALGFFRIRANIDYSVKVAPFPFRTKDGRIIYPIGAFITYVTLEELRAVEGDNRTKYEILESWQFIPNSDPSYPFKRFIEEQYYKRLKLKESKDPLEQAIKVVLNSIYGKMAQRVNNRMGNLFNAIIASFITGFTRAQLYRFLRHKDLESYIVAFATDSIAVTKEIQDLNSMLLGELKLDKHADDVIFLSNGFYRFNGKWKQRGVGYDHEKRIEIAHLDTRIGDEGQLYIAVETTRTTHIKSGILFNRLKSVGKIEQYEKKIGLNSDRKRMWLDELESLHETKLCDSMPININLVADIIAKKSGIEWEDDREERYEPESEL